LVEPGADLERNADADGGQLDRARSACHEISLAKMMHGC
jgi:hypothetical protein